jgi:hypothetical protein
MKTILAVALTLLCLAAEANQTDSTYKENLENTLNAIHDSVRKRFKYTKGNPKGEVFEYYGSYGKIRGDCDDFASAIYYQLWKLDADPVILAYDVSKYKSWPKGYRHTIVCALGYCFDNNRRNIYKERVFHKSLSSNKFKLVGEGKLKKSNMEKLLLIDIEGEYYPDVPDTILLADMRLVRNIGIGGE